MYEPRTLVHGQLCYCLGVSSTAAAALPLLLPPMLLLLSLLLRANSCFLTVIDGMDIVRKIEALGSQVRLLWQRPHDCPV